jgi:hypothetical protein
MTAQQFLTITSSTPPPALRQAMAAALAVEPTHRQDALPRFYDRVLDELGLGSQTDPGASKARRKELAAQKPAPAPALSHAGVRGQAAPRFGRRISSSLAVSP